MGVLHRSRPAVARRDVTAVLDGLAAAVLGGAGTDRLVARLCDLLGLPVAVLDAGLRVRAWAAPAALRLGSAPSLTPAVRDVPAVRDALAGLGPARPSAVVAPCPAHGVGRRHLVAVLVVDGATAGYLDVAEMGRAIEGSDAVVARQAAAALSLLDVADARAASPADRARDAADLRAAADLPDVPDVVGELATLRLVVGGGRADVAVRFAERCLGPLRRNDDATGGDLVATLRAYLASGAQVRATATVLGVHENTVRYRLGRIERVTGLDPRSFDALLAVRLAFQVEDLAGGQTSSE